MSLIDMLKLPEEHRDIWEELVSNYSIRVLPMRNQPEEVRDKYQSDYRLIAEYLACCKDKEKLNDAIRKYGRHLIHMEEVLDMLEVLSGDRHYEKLKALYYREEKTGKKVEDVCLLLDMYWNDGVEQGMERGMEHGIEIFIQTFQEMKNTMEDTKELIVKKFSLSPEQAEVYIRKYW